MRPLALIGILISLSGTLLAQAPYAGGEGDGYARVLVQQTPVSIQALLPEGWRIGPNPLKANEWLHISWPGSAEGTQIMVHDVKGRMILRHSIRPQTTTYRLPLPSTISGMYILEIRQGDLLFHQKIQAHAK